MQSNPNCTALGIYSEQSQEVEAARQALSRLGGVSVAVFSRDGVQREDARLRRYARLRLDDESLVAAEFPASRAVAALELLRNSGSPLIFLLREDLYSGGSDVATAPPPKRVWDKRTAILAHLRENQDAFDAARRDLAAASRLGHALPAAAEWILDNAYLVRTHIADVRRHLPKDYRKVLPTRKGAGCPQVYEIAQDLVIRTNYVLNDGNITGCLQEHQKEEPLTLAELWLFPLLLRVALFEELAILATRVNRAQQLREAAYLWANRLSAAARSGEAEFNRMLKLMDGEPISSSSYFVISLAEQLQDNESPLANVQRWIEQRFEVPLTELVRNEHTREAAESVSASNAFGSLRALSRIEFAAIVETVSVVEAELRTDPGGVYPRNDFETRDRCRRVVERIARHSPLSERDVATRAVELARVSSETSSGGGASVLFYLLAEGVEQLEVATSAYVPRRMRLTRALRRNATPFYLSSITVLILCFAALAIAAVVEGGVHSPLLLTLLGVLALFPLSELSIQLVNALVISLFPPEPLPKMDFRNGIPPEDATLVVVPMMLTSMEAALLEVEKLEVRFLANQEANLFFCLFSDFTDSETLENSNDSALLQAVRGGIEDLNARYRGSHFLHFHRSRSWSESEQLWIGRERKRGKIEELNAWLLGANSPPEILHAGSLPLPIRYVITLDSDTQLPAGTARRLVETIAHPLNRVSIHPATRVRERGFVVIQPRVSIALPGATVTRFTRIFADTTGTDPYCQAVSDAHQDLFGEATFHGKAIYDVAAFHEILADRFPAETILSHDLIEGAHAGVGLATDIELFENLPLDYVSYSQRARRWIRGDWQIAPWILPRVPAPGGWIPNPLSAINRWRIFDNLRRSLVPVASLLLLLLGWLISAAPGVWSLVVALAVVIPALAPLADRLARRIQGSIHRWQGSESELVRTLVMIAFLPHQAWISLDAIGRVIYRGLISRRRLLEWQPADAALAPAQRHHASTSRQMLIICGLTACLATVVYAEGAFPTAGFLIFWMGSPLLLRWLAWPAEAASHTHLDAQDVRYLRRTARRTWRFFDDLVGPETNWLPPDNTQLALRIEVAQRTSPTNIGLWLSSSLAAVDLGYLTLDDFLRRVENTMTTLQRLERYEGHLLNWYDIRTLHPLEPRYISTVDSGNLLASLWVIARGCEDCLNRPLVGQACVRGLADTLSVLHDACSGDPSIDVLLRTLRRLLRGHVDGKELISRIRLSDAALTQLKDAKRWEDPGEERSYWASRMVADLTSWTETVDRYLRWMETLTQPPDSALRTLGNDAVKLRLRALNAVPSLEELGAGEGIEAINGLLSKRKAAGLDPEIARWLDQLAGEYQQARDAATATLGRLHALAASSKAFGDSFQMGFLYDKSRRLFGIGYALGGPVQYTSHYDLLASECRLASLVAIAKGEIPVEHWFALSRPRGVVPGNHQVMLSWSGTMFEYLMPLLFVRSFDNSLLDQAVREAVREQVRYGDSNDIPWGISECAYSALDGNQTYQYRAFGVPRLALKPGLEDDLVVAPYATMLALLVDPDAALRNLKRLDALDLNGPMGYYEAIDFSRERKRDGQKGVVIFAYMAHHQGMTLLALTEILHHDVMRRRFHGDVRVRSIESLLFERFPITRPPKEDFEATPPAVRLRAIEEPAERSWQENTAIPRVHLQGNGRYAIMLTNSGGGYSRWNEFDITRWRPDAAGASWGSFFYVKDLRTQKTWSATHQPTGGRAGSSSVSFSPDRAEFQRLAFDIETRMSITVAPDDDLELRKLTINNHSLRKRQLEFTSYCELALAAHRADVAHPAFAKIFVETERLDQSALIARRRPRSPDDPPIWVAHVLVGAQQGLQCETDRAKFLGRGNAPGKPEALRRSLSGSTGAVLDPVFSLRCRVTLEARDQVEITFITMAASSREALIALIEKCRRPDAVARTFEMAWTRAQLEFRYLGIGPAASHRFQELAGHLIFPNARLRAPQERLLRNQLGQAGLWAHKISGELPMLTVTIADPRHLPFVRELLLAHTYFRLRGFRLDLIVFNQESHNYDLPLRQQLLRQIEAHSAETGIDRPGGVFLLDWHAMPEAFRNLILAVSSVVLSGARGPLHQQLAAPADTPDIDAFVPSGSEEQPSSPLPFLELPYFNGLGGFTPDGREYAIYLKPGTNTPTPWVNVMANPGFGTMISESGLGFTWSGNSQMNRLTPWHNDPASDPQSEAIYLRDEDGGAIWTPTALPIREKDAHRARHGQGYTVYEHNSHAIEQELTVFVPMNDCNGDPVKVYRLRLRNSEWRQRRLSATYFAEWVLGTAREDQQLHIQTSRDLESGALLATQSWSGAFSARIAFAASSPRASTVSGDRTQFLGKDRSANKPAALDLIHLDGVTGAGLDPCAALQVSVTIEPGQQTEIIFLLGQGKNLDEVRSLTRQYLDNRNVQAALETTQHWWDERLNVLQVKTPLLSTNFLLNRWLPYQALSCRFWARSALYQSGGAMGFRDQLQDAMALVYAFPQLTRAHILTAASRQFVEGDVQHWWHPDTGLGVRTRCSDDLVWLPHVVAFYVEVTGDREVLDVDVPFLAAEELKDGEAERMFTAVPSQTSAPLWEHCSRALDRAHRLGQHGLPLFGNGDWNDGMSRVGIEGRGESVWLAWFLCEALESFSKLLEDRPGGQEAALRWRARAAQLAAAVESSCWDGDWYIRGFFDNGAPLGSHVNTEARIDSIAQSWAVISEAGDPSRAHRAMKSADRLLVDEKNRMVLLFSPPFDHSEPHPGYIMGYPPGMRENGGQYTHGSLWMASAWARLNDGDAAVRLLNLMNPVEHSRNPEAVEQYRGEPYVVAADVSSAAGRAGQCGWTWYTGSAGWMYRVWIEDVLGFRLRGDSLSLRPVIPSQWSGFELEYRYHGTIYKIDVRRRASDEILVEMDGRHAPDATIKLTDDGGVHAVTVWLPRWSASAAPSRERNEPATPVALGGGSLLPR